MLELPNICPVCWAFQDPDTHKCLCCGHTWHITLKVSENQAIAKDECGAFAYVGKLTAC